MLRKSKLNNSPTKSTIADRARWKNFHQILETLALGVWVNKFSFSEVFPVCVCRFVGFCILKSLVCAFLSSPAFYCLLVPTTIKFIHGFIVSQYCSSFGMFSWMKKLENWQFPAFLVSNGKTFQALHRKKRFFSFPQKVLL